ncbi:N-acetylglucosamine-6-phosphate deacetylase [Polystyrenella longa]|uniref:N-acetylglucosamine-6-phosphate deacetylase n=1 Tax=Polystyrenella longa TaxID=2528007 RepID=A0A518CS27_9PLAN|nr:amidohydrolase family protein [Polystyrenella longa]QDU82031.1 N-acetylglucosamine-6-phosphate deacetylase [Polystyrenella longa]
MITQRLSGKRYDTLEPVMISWEGGRIQTVEPLRVDDEDTKKLPYLAPGLFDMQINGYGGIWFCKRGLTVDEAIQAIEPYLAAGVTKLFPTLITSSHEALADGFATLKEVCEEHPEIDQLVAGCHLEGPYLSAEDGSRGAHPLEHIRPADWTEFSKLQELSGNRIKLITVAPEQEGVLEFIPKAVNSGVVVSIGHTAASPDLIRAAADAGARMSTHLGNGAQGMIRRHPNYIWEQLADDRLHCCLITDGHHIPGSVAKIAYRVKGYERMLITCDASGLAGLSPGVYESESLNVEILEDGRHVIAGQNQLLAGSGATTEMCVAELPRMVEEISLADAVDFASRNPGRLFGIETGLLEPGGLADMIQFDYDESAARIDILKTVVEGQLRYTRSGQASE